MIDYRDFEHIGREIKDVVQSAIDSQDFSRLNSTINQTISKVKGSSFTHYNQNSSHSPAEIRFSRTPKGRVSGPVLTVLGYSFAGIFGLTALILLLSTIFLHPLKSIWIANILMLLFTGISLILGFAGQRKWNLVKRFRSYARLLGSRTYCSVEDFALLAQKKKGALLSDLTAMIKNGMFPQGHLDPQKTYFMLTDEVFRQYCASMKEMERRRRESAAVSAAESSPALSRECEKILQEGQEYIRHIHHCNDLLPGAEISEKLDRLETIMTRIFDQVKKDPDLAPELHKFMNYYLPTTRKLLDAYCELDIQPVSGDNINSTKLEIERTLDTINEAFENLLDRFFEDTAWDISSDISVMKTMLAQEGLTEDPLSKAGKERK